MSVTWSHGSIVRVYMKDFMQYGEATFEPGPCLNVILGPNGSGKSTLVNAICLGVGGKAKFLDRAKDPREFIREGTDSAEIQIELFNRDGDNWIIGRRWSNKDARTYWSINGAGVAQKNVTELARELRIQVENLCQFLPQDKVQSFSKMNAQTLLDSTIEAAGEESLKETHRKLKVLQKEYENSEDQLRSDSEVLAQKTSSMERMEGDVQNYHEKQKVDEKISLYKKKRLWLLFAQRKEEVRDIEEEKKGIESTVRDWEKKEIRPTQSAIDGIKSSLEAIDEGIRSQLCDIRGYVNDSKNYSHKIENLGDEYGSSNLHLEEILSRASEREDKIQSMQREISYLKSTGDDQDEEGVQAEYSSANAELGGIAQEESNLETKIKSVDRDITRIQDEMALKQEEIKRLTDVDAIKISRLAASFPDGKDAVSALEIVRGMKLKGRFYPPLILTLELKDPSHAFYFENSIQVRDLVAFGAEEKEDVSHIIRVLRKEKGLKVNAIHLSAEPPGSFKPKIAPEAFPRECYFKGYLSELFDAPGPVKAFLCKQYRLHNTAVFGAVQPDTIGRIVNDLKLTSFFADRERYTVIVSAYTAESSSTSFTAHPRNWIQSSGDASRIGALEEEKRTLEERRLGLLDANREDHSALKTKRKSKEESTERVSKLHQKVNLIRQQRKKLQIKEKNLSALILAGEDNSEEESARKELERKKRTLIKRLLELNTSLFEVIRKHGESKIGLDMHRLKRSPIAEELKEEEDKLKGLKAEVAELQRKAEDKRAEAKRLMGLASEISLELEKLTGSRRVSDELKAQWDSVGVPEDVDRIEEDLEGLEAESACIGSINRSVVEEYLRLKESVESLEASIASRGCDTSKKMENISSLKAEWIGRLTALVDRLDAKFRYNFDYMGYAGQIQLRVPDERNNFEEDYGIEIFVKYRQSVRLAKLTPHMQSGGERSVATALYMLSLQELTTVPFRCVDEINQGMDALNERKVFDILINTSSREESAAAQYFLLTPKLLPDLTFSELVRVHVVYNGPHMLQYPAMSARKFLDKARERGL